MSWVS